MNGKPVGVVNDQLNILNWAVKEKGSGKVFFTYENVATKDNACDIEFNFTMDFSTSIDNVSGSCCINITTDKDKLHICSKAA